jgi:DNA-binding transcriptional LysR family regulator
LIVPLNHPWARRNQIQPNELFDDVFIMREATSGSYRSVQKSLGSLGVDISKLHTSMMMGTSEAVALAVAQNLGVGFVAKTIIEKICAGRVACVDVEGMTVYQDILIARQTRETATNAQVAFWDFIRSQKSLQYHDADWITEMQPMPAG